MNPALLNRGLHILLWASFGYFLGLAVGIAIEKINHKEFSDRIGSAVAGGIGGGATILLIQSVWVSAVFHGRRKNRAGFLPYVIGVFCFSHFGRRDYHVYRDNTRLLLRKATISGYRLKMSLGMMRG